jgi:hypothetical protein
MNPNSQSPARTATIHVNKEVFFFAGAPHNGQLAAFLLMGVPQLLHGISPFAKAGAGTDGLTGSGGAETGRRNLSSNAFS